LPTPGSGVFVQRGNGAAGFFAELRQIVHAAASSSLSSSGRLT
jgi:hypothetical protein